MYLGRTSQCFFLNGNPLTVPKCWCREDFDFLDLATISESTFSSKHF